MKPLIVSIDIVAFSTNNKAKLKNAMDAFFNLVCGMGRDCGRHVLPTGDGAILVWTSSDRDVPAAKETGVANRILKDLLTVLKGWSVKHKCELRVGVHCDSFVEELNLGGILHSVYGHGISKSVRYQTAADPNQALLSEDAYAHLDIGSNSPDYSVGEPITFFDKHGIRHLAYPIGLKNDSHWSLGLPASAQESAVRVELRRKELPANNEFLKTAESATFVAMTYKSLGHTFAESGLRLEKLRKARLYVYSLCVLRSKHPTLRANPADLQSEWVQGVTSAIEGLLDAGKCPSLDMLDLVILSISPALTATLASRTRDGHEDSVLRYHPIVDEIEPETTPTIIINKHGDVSSPLFKAFESIVTKLGSDPPRLTFAIKRNGYRRDLTGFVERLRKVCNHPEYAPKDLHFDVYLSIPSPSVTSDEISPEQASHELRGHRRSNKLSVAPDWHPRRLLLSMGSADGCVSRRINQPHLFASFVLMSSVDYKNVLLVNDRRGGWDFDVPGGKVTELDRSPQCAAAREVFEELGLVLDEERLGKPVGAVYDPRSDRERGHPVVAQYFHYALEAREEDYLRTVGATTKGRTFAWYPLDELQHKKGAAAGAIEILCHASLGSIEYIVKHLRQMPTA